MKQPVSKKITNKNRTKKKVVTIKPQKVEKTQQKYGTSMLEKYFAENFLDKFGIQYIYEYEAKDIKRFYDFAIVKQNENYITEQKEGLKSVIPNIQHCPVEFLIEVDGGYW